MAMRGLGNTPRPRRTVGKGSGGSYLWFNDYIAGVNGFVGSPFETADRATLFMGVQTIPGCVPFGQRFAYYRLVER